jgi:bis(5'-nucleosyl)-tetraphosphatase (symmetrical)
MTVNDSTVDDVIAVGDIQGCFDCFQQLLENIERPNRQPKKFWLCGDLVNRGPQSLAMLRWAYQNRDQLVTVLGNHDLHFLAVLAGARKPSRSDTLNELLLAHDCEQLADWLRRQPLAHYQDGHLLVHAGMLPQWSVADALAYSAEVQAVLAGPNWQTFLHQMYGDEPRQWQDGLQGVARLRVIINGLTRLRFCSAAGEMEFASKEGSASAPPGMLPWFDVPERASQDCTIVFGHWSTLGLVDRSNLLGLDTGCVWGGALSAVRLADRELFQVSCPQAANPRPG